MKKLILVNLIILILFALLYFLVDLENKDKVEEKIVTKIIDGDTIIVQGGETIRLLGVDCDERGKECYNEAKEYVESELLGRKVKLEKIEEDKDRYGRSLRYIILNNSNLNIQLISEGYCIARIENIDNYKEEIISAENFAILNKVGCKWSNV